jgi:hypothetical protein
LVRPRALSLLSAIAALVPAGMSGMVIPVAAGTVAAGAADIAGATVTVLGVAAATVTVLGAAVTVEGVAGDPPPHAATVVVIAAAAMRKAGREMFTATDDIAHPVNM